jgi:hypothetical protein
MITYLTGPTQSAWQIGFLVVYLGLLVQPAYADDSPNAQFRHAYTDQNAPPEIRFRIFLRVATTEVEGTYEIAMRHLEEAGFKKSDVPRVHDYLVSLNEEAEKEIDKGIWRIACHADAQNLKGLEIRVVFNSFDDLRFAVAAKYLAIASAELANKGYPDFQNMISNFPGASSSFSTFSSDHRLTWGDNDAAIQSSRTGICYALYEKLGYELEER